ncbi:MAG TPA: hypothetical protein VGQ55_04180 [Pyrinomonadaceae bacterium]|nr:hypothetical protein [Pyrinomonadaceae bacterium]
MPRNWMEFDGGPSVASPKGVYVSMNKHGEIVMNRHTFQEMDQPPAVVILFDPDTDTIGLRPTSPLMPNAFPVKSKGNCGHRLISAKPFVRKHDIRIDATVRFHTAAVEDGVLVLELRNMVRAARGPRKWRKK